MTTLRTLRAHAADVRRPAAGGQVVISPHIRALAILPNARRRLAATVGKRPHVKPASFAAAFKCDVTQQVRGGSTFKLGRCTKCVNRCIVEVRVHSVDIEVVMPYDHLQNPPDHRALVQMSCTEAKQPNVASGGSNRRGSQSGANVICLQELFTGPYFARRRIIVGFSEADPFQGQPASSFAATANKHGVVVIRIAIERGLRACITTRLSCRQRRFASWSVSQDAHPDDPCTTKILFHAGRLGFRAFPTKFGKSVSVSVGPWYPERRLTALERRRSSFIHAIAGCRTRKRNSGEPA